MEQQAVSVYIKRASNQFDKLANQALLDYDISSTQFKFLKFLYKKENFSMMQSDIERHFDMANPTVTRVLQKMEQKGFIIRQVNPKDARSKVIGLTDKSFQLQDQFESIGQELEMEMTKRLNQAQSQDLLQLLKLMLGEEDADK